MPEQVKLSPIKDVIASFGRGEMVIIIDDADRENEGDLCVATELVTPEILNFMMQFGRGLICVSISSECANRLALSPQVEANNSSFGTPFTVSINHRQVNDFAVTAESRAFTMKSLLNPSYLSTDFVSPGCVFPLVANPAGVLGRRGQTEGSFDLARMAGLAPSGIICEILNSDGTMSRGAELNAFAEQHGLMITSIEEILRYRIDHEVLVREVACSKLSTDYGDFDTYVFENDVDGKEHLALVYGLDKESLDDEVPLVRIHSECLTGDVFGSRRCDCGQQLDQAMQHIVKAGCGLVLYLRQEGRGIGLANKLKAYQLQDQGRDTVEANIELGFEADQRDFAVAAQILHTLGCTRVQVLTNNPKKVCALTGFGIDVAERIPLVVKADKFNHFYLDTKREKLGHLL